MQCPRQNDYNREKALGKTITDLILGKRREKKVQQKPKTR